MCACKNNNNTEVVTNNNVVEKPNNIIGCDTTLEFLTYLNNLISLNLGNSAMTDTDKYLLQVYKGQILSGINLTNYCYTDYKIVETSVYNVISKYI